MSGQHNDHQSAGFHPAHPHAGQSVLCLALGAGPDHAGGDLRVASGIQHRRDGKLDPLHKGVVRILLEPALGGPQIWRKLIRPVRTAVGRTVAGQVADVRGAIGLRQALASEGLRRVAASGDSAALVAGIGLGLAGRRAGEGCADLAGVLGAGVVCHCKSLRGFALDTAGLASGAGLVFLHSS